MLRKDSNIHIVGASSTEMSAVYLYLHKRGFPNVTLHDFSEDFRKSLKLSHRFYSGNWINDYLKALGQAKKFNGPSDYLNSISEADVIFVPQSWFIYSQNSGLCNYKNKLSFFIDFCFELFKGRIIGVTGTVGKSTTALYTSILTDALLTGNDRENILDLDDVERSDKDFMVFEISNRHLKNEFKIKVDFAVLTNICPNHIPDHGSLEDYCFLKNEIFNNSHVTIYNASNPYVDLVIKPNGESYSFSLAHGFNACIENGSVYVLDEYICEIRELPLDYDHEVEDFLSSCLVAKLCGIDTSILKERIKLLDRKLFYRSKKYEVQGVTIINDAASCLPENAKRLTESLREDFVLITGGSRQAPLDDEFHRLAWSIANNKNVEKVFCIGDMRERLAHSFKQFEFDDYMLQSDLESAVVEAINNGAGCIVFSPGCGSGDEFFDKYERGEVFDDYIRKYLQAE